MEALEQMRQDFQSYPTVYVTGDEYEIAVMALSETLVWVEVGEETYYDHSNGVLRSAKAYHSVKVPMEVLDAARSYTICYRKVVERKPYWTQTEDVCKLTFTFYPVEGDRLRIYHIADTHNKLEPPIRAGQYFGEAPDLLILNGDIPNHSGKLEYFDSIHKIAGEITKGERPAIFSRGNHDTRGIYAENFSEYTPTYKGDPYFTFRLGDLWGIVIDCGEDKEDTREEYGNTVCFSYFRKQETRFIERVIKNADTEYNAPGVRRRVVISHMPFPHIHIAPFDIEQETYAYWTKLLREEIKPQVMLCGHLHETKVHYPGEPFDDFGQPCPIVVGANPHRAKGEDPSLYDGTAIVWENNRVNVYFTNQDREVVGEDSFEV